MAVLGCPLDNPLSMPDNWPPTRLDRVGRAGGRNFLDRDQMAHMRHHAANRGGVGALNGVANPPQAEGFDGPFLIVRATNRAANLGDA